MLSFRLYDHRGAVFDGEHYDCCLDVSEDPPYSPDPPAPDDGEEYFILTFDYFHNSRAIPGRVQTLCLYSSQSVVDRRDFYSSTETIVADMFADLPWQIPADLISPTGPWLRDSATEAINADIPEFGDAFRATRALSLNLSVTGPNHPGGPVFVLEDYIDDDYESALEEMVEPEDGDVDGTCAICLGDLVGREVLRTPCSHRFHYQCVLPWLMRRNTCPSCRRAVVMGRLQFL